MCYSPKTIRTAQGPKLVRCGECLECRKEFQSDVAHRLWIQSKRAPSIHFWTLTYSYDHLPLFCRMKDEKLEELGHNVRITLPIRHDKNVPLEIRMFDKLPFKYYGYWDDDTDSFVDTDCLGAVLPETEEKIVKYDALVPSKDCPLSPNVSEIDSRISKFEEKFEHIFSYSEWYKLFLSMELNALNSLRREKVENTLFDLRGEYVNRGKFDSKSVKHLVRMYEKFSRSNGNKCLPMDFMDDYTVTPSLCSRDVQLWIKRFRGGDGHRHSFDFKYYVRGEHGTRTLRPHYHMLTFGLTDSQCEEMRREWIRMFGNSDSELCNLTQFKRVPLLSRDGKPIAGFAARYVSKYISKGKYECPTVKQGLCAAPRSLASKGLWTISEEEFRHYTGYDILCDYADEYKKSDEFLSLPASEQSMCLAQGLWRFLPERYYTDDIIDRILARLHYSLPNDFDRFGKIKCYGLGKSIRNKLFKYETENKQKYCRRIDGKKVEYYLPIKKRVLATPLSLAITARLQCRHTEDFFREYQSLRQEKPYLPDSLVLDEIQRNYFLAFKDREMELEKNIKKFLQKTLF